MSDTRRKAPTLYRKTLASLVSVVAVVVFSGGLIGTRVLERRAIGHVTQSLMTAARLMEPEILHALTVSPEVPVVQPLVSSLSKRGNCRVTVIDPSGLVLGDSEQTQESVRQMENHRDRPEVKAALAGDLGTSLRYSQTVKHPMLYVAVPLMSQDEMKGALRVAVPITVVAELRQEIRRTVLVSLLVGLVLAVALGAWLARRVTKPLSRLTELANAYAKGDLTASTQDVSLQEVSELTEALNKMAQALREQLDELTTERNQATAILESMAEGVMAVDPHGRLLLMNPAAQMLLGVGTTRTVGQSVFEVLRHQEAQVLLRAVLQNRERTTKDMTLFHPHARILRLHGVPCQGGGPTGLCAVLVIQDVTESTRYEQLRKEFVANVSHELKSPLTSIRSLTETLLGGALNDPANNRRFVQLIDEDTTRLSHLIDDLLALSQIESQAVPLQLSVVELKTVAESVLTSLQRSLSQRGISAALELPAGLAVRADPDRLRQVMFNLVENAIKYNKPGGTMTVSAVRDSAWATVTISDTGIGIPADHLPRIFERFYRVDKARSRELGGTGLGLSIVKHIIEAHGGRVSVDSQLDRGSAFSFTLPLAS